LAKSGISGRIIVAILAFIGLIAVIDIIAGTGILESLWNHFVDLMRDIGEKLGGVVHV